MYFTYIWQARGLSPEEARLRFAGVLSRQSALYHKATGRSPECDIFQMKNILIGQLRYESGISGWRPVVETGGDICLFWGGVCEDYLGVDLARAGAEDIWRILEDNPGEIRLWDGAFYVVALNKKRKAAILATAATECPTLWYTEGAYGWAAGPRGGAILSLVGRGKRANPAALNLFLVYERFGGYSFFEGVHRINDRKRVIVREGERPRIDTYIPLDEYLEPNGGRFNWKDGVSAGAERIFQRVTKQLTHTVDPVVLLTGGIDSRAIACAAKKSLLPFTALTDGPPDSEDVRVALRVAKKINLQHRHENNTAPNSLLMDSEERLRLWSGLSEGLETLRHILPYKKFLQGTMPFPAQRMAAFHGNHPGLGKGYFYPDKDLGKSISAAAMHDYMLKRKLPSRLRLIKGANDLLQEVFTQVDDFIRRANGASHQWIDFFFWRDRGLYWGMDCLSAKSVFYWHWTPLFDREMIKLSWGLPLEAKVSKRYMYDVTRKLEPSVSRIKYAEEKKITVLTRIARRIYRETNHHMGRVLRRGYPEGDMRAFWTRFLANKKNHIWDEFIDAKGLDDLIRLEPDSSLLWNLATIEFFAVAHLSA